MGVGPLEAIWISRIAGVVMKARVFASADNHHQTFRGGLLPAIVVFEKRRAVARL
jgi:hypothetical protein